MTDQEAFDKMMNHLRSLKAPSMNIIKNACVYNGSKCAVGALMTDEEQETFGMCEGNASDLLEDMARAYHVSELHSLNRLMLIDMQYLHDTPLNWSDKGFDHEGGAERIAAKYDLDYTAPETAN